jgi:hypothetical protein
MADKLIDVATLQPNHGQISQDSGTATCRQVVVQGVTEGAFSEIRTSKLNITATTFFSQPRTIKPQPSAIARIIRQFTNLLSRVQGTLARG